MAVKRGAGGEPQYYDENSGKYGSSDSSTDHADKDGKLDRVARKWESRTVSDPNQVPRDSLTKAEWAEYYKKLGEIKAGTLKVRRTKNGGRLIVIDKKVVIDNGKFMNPKVKSVQVFGDTELLSGYLRKIDNGGFIKWE